MSKTIYDIARIAGVSPATVSRVINNNYPVSKETRQIVEKVIIQEGFRPNLIAKGLITKTTSNLGVVVPGITNIFFPSIVEEINKNIIHEEFIISLFTTSGSPEDEKSVIENIISRRMDGILIIDPSIENIENGYLSEITRQIPSLIISGMTDYKGLNFISYNEETGTREALEYLSKLGHDNILFIRGDKSISYDLRENIYNDHILKNKIEYKKVISVGQGNTEDVLEETEKIIRSWIKDSFDASAIFACNDLMAVGAMNAFINNGISIPDQVSIIGFDNTIVSRITNPRLTTVDIDTKFIGRKASGMIMDMIKKKILFTERVLMDTKVIYRESCKERQTN